MRLVELEASKVLAFDPCHEFQLRAMMPFGLSRFAGSLYQVFPAQSVPIVEFMEFDPFQADGALAPAPSPAAASSSSSSSSSSPPMGAPGGMRIT